MGYNKSVICNRGTSNESNPVDVDRHKDDFDNYHGVGYNEYIHHRSNPNGFKYNNLE